MIPRFFSALAGPSAIGLMVSIGLTAAAYAAPRDDVEGSDCRSLITRSLMATERPGGVTGPSDCDQPSRIAADRWLDANAELPQPDAYFEIGMRLEVGYGVPIDKMLAFDFLHAAAVGGHTEAQHHVGIRFLHAGPDAEILENGLFWLGSAAGEGHALSALILGYLAERGSFGVPEDDCLALAWYEASAHMGMAEGHDAMIRLTEAGTC